MNRISCLVIGSLVTLSAFQGFAQDEFVTLRPREVQPLTAGDPPKLSASLRAIRDGDAALKGCDPTGNLIVSVPEGGAEKLAASSSVKSVLNSKPVNWNPIKRLKISYLDQDSITEEELSQLGLKLIEDYKKGSFLIVEPVSKTVDAALIRKLEGAKKIRFATAALRIKAIPPSNSHLDQGVATVSTPRPNDPRLKELWGINNIGAPKAWTKGTESTVVVAVIDTGVDYNHEDLAANMWTGASGSHGYDFVENDANPMDQNGHGTHCAGTVGAEGDNGKGVVGVNWKVKIMALRWLDAGGYGEVSNAIKCIDYAVENGAKVLSNSWFWTEDDPNLEDAIKRAKDAGVIFVAAASNFAEMANNNGGDNDRADTFGRFPSAYPIENIISVAAIDSTENKAPFSHFGKRTVHIGAPGVSVLSTVPGNEYDGTYSGTSMATPHVAGAAALYMSIRNSPDSGEVKKALIENARKIDSLRERCVSGGTLDISFLNN